MQAPGPKSITELLRPVVVAILDHRGDVFGTGFFITPDGYILTCYHVIERYLSGNTVIIKTHKGDELTAEFDESKSCIQSDIDFAILKVKAEEGSDYPYLPLGKESEEGDNWCTLGYNFPLTYGSDYGRGTIFSKSPRLDYKGYNLRLECKLPIRGGSSGSPLVAMKSGSVIGIINSTPMEDGSKEAFATPIQDVLSIWPELEKLNSPGPSLIKLPLEETPIKPLESKDTVPHEIPPPLQDFIGRDSEIKELMDYFEHGATILGLRGMDGVGKTALAYKLAEMLKDRYSDGQLMVNLQETSSEPLKPVEAMTQIIRSFDRTISLPENESALAKLYQSMLNGKRILLLLDNALDDSQVRPLLPPSTCCMLVTSRKRFTLPGMKIKDLNILKPSDARELLLAIDARIGDNADMLAQLCGYLPLALRAAGSLLANTLDLDPEQYIEELRAERTRIEHFGSDGIDRDLNANFKLSYSRLPPDTAHVFRAISVFPTDFDAKAEEIVCQDRGHRNLSELVRWSLVDFQSLDRAGRYRLHDLVRLFASAILEKDDDETARIAVLKRHAEYYKNVLFTAEDLYGQGGEGIMEGFSLFDREWANIQAGQRWAESMAIRLIKESETENLSHEKEAALCLSSSYPNAAPLVLDLRLHPREQVRWLETALIVARFLKDRKAEEIHLNNLGLAYSYLGEYRKAIEFYEMALVIARGIKNQGEEGRCLGNLGDAYGRLGQYHKAIELYEQALDVDREIGNRSREGLILGSLGTAYYCLGEHRKAIEIQEECLRINREFGDRRAESSTLGNLGIIYDIQGEYRKAIGFHEQALAIAREIGYRRGEGYDLGNLGLSYYNLGEYKKSLKFQEKRLSITREIGDRWGEGVSLGNLGMAYYRLGQYRKAIEFYEQALAIAREIGNRRGEGNELGNLGITYNILGEHHKAIEFHEQALAIAKEIGERWGEGYALRNLGNAYENLGEYHKTIEFHEKRLAIAREIGDREGEGNSLWCISLALDKIGERAKAIDYAKPALDILERIECPYAGEVRQQLAVWQSQV